MQSINNTQDLFLTMHDILNISCKMEYSTTCTHLDDAISMKNWVVDNPTHIFYYQAMNDGKDQAFSLQI